MLHRTKSTLALALVVALSTTACGRNEPASDDAGSSAETAATEDTDAAEAAAVPAPVGVVAPPADAYDRPLDVSDIDAYARGVKAELEALAPKVAAVEAARAKKDDAAETMALLDLSTPLDEQAAVAAGLTPQRYRHVRDAIDQVISKKQMGEAMQPQIAAMEQADTTGFTEEQKEQAQRNIAEMKTMWADPYAGLAPDVAAAMKARAAELDKLRNDALAIRLKVL